MSQAALEEECKSLQRLLEVAVQGIGVKQESQPPSVANATFGDKADGSAAVEDTLDAFMSEVKETLDQGKVTESAI